MKAIFFPILTLLFFSSLLSQETNEVNTKEGAIKWLTTEEANKLNKENPKKYWMHIYSKSCGWCSKMENETFANEKVAQYITENYYPVKLSVNDKSDVQWNGKTYHYFKEGPYAGNHELVLRLTMAKKGTPINTIVSENGNDIEMSLLGFLTAEQLFQSLSENQNKSTIN